MPRQKRVIPVCENSERHRSGREKMSRTAGHITCREKAAGFELESDEDHHWILW